MGIGSLCFTSYESLQWFPSAAKRSSFDERQELHLSVNLRRKNTVRDYIDLVIVVSMPPGQPTVKNAVSTLSSDSRATFKYHLSLVTLQRSSSVEWQPSSFPVPLVHV